MLSLVLESARVEGIAARNVCEDVNAPVQGELNRDALSTEAAMSVLKVAAEHDDGTRWWIALLSGPRQGERIGAHLDSLDLDSDQSTIGVEWALSEVLRTRLRPHRRRHLALRQDPRWLMLEPPTPDLRRLRIPAAQRPTPPYTPEVRQATVHATHAGARQSAPPLPAQDRRPAEPVRTHLAQAQRRAVPPG